MRRMAVRMALSLIGRWLLRALEKTYPKKYKKTRVSAGFVDVIGCFRKLSDQVKWWSRGEPRNHHKLL